MAAEASEGEVERVSSRNQSYPRDLLRRFAGTTGLNEPPESVGGGSGEIELSLGLSLGGCFGVDPKEKRIFRSSSIADLSMFPREHDFMVAPGLNRTCSLPTEAEEELRKRKELQSLKRLEAKRKRSEKRNWKSGTKDRTEENCDEDLDGGQAQGLTTKLGKVGIEQSGCPGVSGSTQFEGPMNGVIPPRLPGWVMGSGRSDAWTVDESRCFTPMSQGSIGSHGSSSSGVSDFESLPVQGFDISRSSACPDVRSLSVVQTLPEHTNYKAATTSSTTLAEKPGNCTREDDDSSKKTTVRGNETREMERNMMDEMPCVTTQGDGPNGRRIEGFLYKYRKGEEVRIVCVCHGSFLTPAEFVKHAGGGDVAHPLRHIVVSPSPSTFL